MIKWILLIVALVVLLVPRRRSSLVIVTAHYNEDIEWLKKSKYPVVLCDKPGAKSSSFTPDKSCTLDVNRGREASSYLKYIVENYDRLPDRIAFIHGHETAEHQRYPGHILQAIDDAREDFDFINLNNDIHLEKSSCSTKIPESKVTTTCDFTHIFNNLMKKDWETLFKPMVGFELPEYLRFGAHSQFITTRKAIRRHSKERYQKLLDYMIEEGQNDYDRGLVLEFLWESILSGHGADMCKTLEDCTNSGYRKSRFYS